MLSDLGLPDGTGLDLMAELHGRYGVQGIALSGYGMEEDVRKSLEAGFERHLTKPINLQALQTAIQETARTGVGPHHPGPLLPSLPPPSPGEEGEQQATKGKPLFPEPLSPGAGGGGDGREGLGSEGPPRQGRGVFYR